MTVVSPSSSSSMTTMRVLTVSAAAGRPNFDRRSTTGMALPRTFTTPRMYSGAVGTLVIWVRSRTSRTWLTLMANSSSPSLKVMYWAV